MWMVHICIIIRYEVLAIYKTSENDIYLTLQIGITQNSRCDLKWVVLMMKIIQTTNIRVNSLSHDSGTGKRHKAIDNFASIAFRKAI